MGRPDVTKPVDGPEFERFHRAACATTRHLVARSPAPSGCPRQGPPYDDVVPVRARASSSAFPDRVLWGTDWPHPNMKTHMPDDGVLVDFIPRIAPTAELQQQAAGRQPHAPLLGRAVDDRTKPLSTTSPAPPCSTPSSRGMGYHLNQFCMSLMKADNRERLQGRRARLSRRVADDRGPEAGRAGPRLEPACSQLGGNIYFTSKIAATDGLSFQQAAAMMTGVSQEEYAAMMLAGGRSIEGNRSSAEGQR